MEVMRSVGWRHLPGTFAQVDAGVIVIGPMAPSELRLPQPCPLVVRPQGCLVVRPHR